MTEDLTEPETALLRHLVAMNHLRADLLTAQEQDRMYEMSRRWPPLTRQDIRDGRATWETTSATAGACTGT